MWVFDGEDWVNEGASTPEKSSPSHDRHELEEFYPEVQIVEVPLRPEPVPYFPPVIP